MKKLLVVFLLIFAKNSYAQGNDSLLNKYEDGVKVGKWIGHWIESGKISYIEYYISGKKNGLCKYFAVNGDLINEIEYSNDTINGFFKYYSPNGQKEIAEFKDGKREGLTKYYNYKNILVEEFEYHNNLRNGFHRLYSKKGKITMESKFINGRENGTRRTYNDKNEVILEADFQDDRRIEIRTYKKGKLIKATKDIP